MVNLISSTTSEVLGLIESDNYQLFKGITTTFKQGNYIKLPSQEFIPERYPARGSTTNLLIPNKYGYKYNKGITEIEFEYNEI